MTEILYRPKHIVPVNIKLDLYRVLYFHIKRKVYKLEIMENMLLIKQQLNNRTF